MFNRYLQIGIIAVAVVLLATALITAKTDSRSQQSEAKNFASATAELTAGDPAPSRTPASDRAIAAAANFSKAVLDVQGMSCSGCIYEIKSSLAKLNGIGDVLVDLNSGRVEVYYDDTKLKDVGQIAAAITAVGYPARLQRTLNADEIGKQDSAMASRSQLYIAAVGDWEIARGDYNAELVHARTRYKDVYGKEVFNGDNGDALLQRLKSQVISRLITEGIQLQEIRKAGFKLPPQTVESE